MNNLFEQYQSINTKIFKLTHISFDKTNSFILYRSIFLTSFYKNSAGLAVKIKKKPLSYHKQLHKIYKQK